MLCRWGRRQRRRVPLQVLGYTDFAKEDPSRPANFFDEPPDRDLTVCCIVGIKDPVRQEVPGAVKTCKRAGITVRMVTGDNIHTAQHIARECGILDESGFAMEGPEFRNVPRKEMMERLGKLQVLLHTWLSALGLVHFSGKAALGAVRLSRSATAAKP